MARCWLIGEERSGFPRLAAQMAALRGLPAMRCADALEEVPADHGTLLAVGLERLRLLEPRAQAALERALGRGATLYVRGTAPAQINLRLPAALGGGFALAPATAARSYRFHCHPLLPPMLAGYEALGQFTIGGVAELPPAYEPVLTANGEGPERAAIFVHRHQAGMVVFDLGSDEHETDAGLLFRLADPQSRVETVGGLIAVDRACGRDLRRPVGFNLTLDDRPANRDYLNREHLRRFLERTQAHLPGAHVDFSWTPDQSHPSPRYVELIKRFDGGFLWHGFAHHVHHDSLADPEAEMAAGLRLVEQIQRRYGVRFQPVMVFPFERGGERSTQMLARFGFQAMALSLFAYPETFAGLPSYLSHSIIQRSAGEAGPLLLRRQAIERFPTDLMLAHAIMGLPVLALAHPEDFALKRFPRPWAGDSMAELDRVLDAAAAWGLRPRSMEQIAQEVAELQAAVSGRML